MLETCVLVGLDWVESMMNFSLHVTCSCIIHAYVPFHFLFWYSLLMVLFCLSPSPPFLSLSLTHSLRMVPKYKTTLSQIPLHSRASSSDPTPLHVRFHDEKAYQDFSENFSKRGLHSERHMILSNFSILLYPLSFTVGVGNIYVRYPWVVPSWSYRSFTLIFTILIIMCLGLLLLFEVQV